ncbi:MAG: glycoside hydrolase family 57 [Alphaproteobacteria bacterium]|nr:glycoside hydrolase family 57 [Alphaproteobacteria bacterium]
MNAPLRAPDIQAASGLNVFAFFHLNLAFSSIEEERRGEVIAHCYWPLLRLAERCGPIGMEVSGYTLEEIAARDPEWIGRARSLIAQGRIELIGSGYSQMIGPLVPARVTEENLRLGHDIYRHLFGTKPRTALINEQAYAAGLVGLYRDAGYDAIIMDWENPAANHPEWTPETQYLPQRARGADGRDIALIWSNTTLFQQLQRFAHGDIDLQTYLRFVRGRRGQGPRALCLYASDAEIFDFRPGRFKTEERLSSQSEWMRLEDALCAVAADAAMTAPSGILALSNLPGAGQTLFLESAACPVPVKKQRKYNLARWAVTGRDNLAINAACQRIYEGMLKSAQPDWKELCHLWASDFRTHLTEKRWAAYRERLQAAEALWSEPVVALPAPRGAAATDRYIPIETPTLRARLDRRRGLAIANLHFKGQEKPALGGLPHGFFDEIALAADWYTGDSVFEAPGEHKLTDLEWCEAHIDRRANGDVVATARIETPKGLIEKTLHFHAAAPQVEFDLSFDWSDWGKGVLRLGHFTLLPDAFDTEHLTLSTTNGGGRENYPLAGRTVEHGAPVSFLVSSAHGFGMTEGWAEIGDGKTLLRVDVDRSAAPLLGMLTHRRAGDKLFCQIQLSALELDDTRKPGAYHSGPRRFRFSVRAMPIE